MIQLGSIVAVVWLYRRKLLEVLRGLPTDPSAQRFALMLFVALLPALVAGALLSGFVTRVLYRTLLVNAVTFVVGGIIILIVERSQKRPTVHHVDDTPVSTALGIGLALGLDRTVATEFSFFLAIPTLTAAFANSLWKVRHELTTAQTTNIVIGFVMAFISSALVIKPFLNYVRRSGFQAFAWYRIVAGLALAVAIAAGWGR
jgi:undecaprenyl-diphosphatase